MFRRRNQIYTYSILSFYSIQSLATVFSPRLKFLMFSGSIVFSFPSGQMSCETEHRSWLACPQKYISPTLISAMKKRQIQSQVSWSVCEVFCSSNCYLMPHIMFYVKSPQNEPFSSIMVQFCLSSIKAALWNRSFFCFFCICHMHTPTSV